MDIKNFFKIHILEILFVLFYGIGDILTTEYIVDNGGTELNPLMLFMINKWGFFSFVIVKVLIIGMLISVNDNKLKWFGVIIGIINVILNLFQIIK